MNDNDVPVQPDHHNDNDLLFGDRMTLAEFLQWIRRRRHRLSRELSRNVALWSCPEHRLDRSINHAMERCARWHHMGDRSV